MTIIDLNQDRAKIVLLIHPMFASASIMKELIAEHLGDQYRYLIPDLSGHGNSSGETYQSAQEESEKLYQYLKSEKIEEITLALGLSLGGIVLLDLLKHKDIKFDKVIFEGTSLWQKSRLLNFLFRRGFLQLRQKASKNKDLPLKKFAQVYGESMGKAMTKSLIEMDPESIKNIVHDCLYVKTPPLDLKEQSKMKFYYGSKEILDLYQAKKRLAKLYPKAELILWEGQNHCSKPCSEPLDYCKMLAAEIAAEAREN